MALLHFTIQGFPPYAAVIRYPLRERIILPQMEGGTWTQIPEYTRAKSHTVLWFCRDKGFPISLPLFQILSGIPSICGSNQGPLKREDHAAANGGRNLDPNSRIYPCEKVTRSCDFVCDKGFPISLLSFKYQFKTKILVVESIWWRIYEVILLTTCN